MARLLWRNNNDKASPHMIDCMGKIVLAHESRWFRS